MGNIRAVGLRGRRWLRIARNSLWVSLLVPFARLGWFIFCMNMALLASSRSFGMRI